MLHRNGSGQARDDESQHSVGSVSRLTSYIAWIRCTRPCSRPPSQATYARIQNLKHAYPRQSLRVIRTTLACPAWTNRMYGSWHSINLYPETLFMCHGPGGARAAHQGTIPRALYTRERCRRGDEQCCCRQRFEFRFSNSRKFAVPIPMILIVILTAGRYGRVSVRR